MKHFTGIGIILIIFIQSLNSSNSCGLELKNKMSEFLRKLMMNDLVAYTRTIQLSVETETKLAKWNFGDVVDGFLRTIGEQNIVIKLRDVNVDDVDQLPFDIHLRVLLVDTYDSLRNLITKQRLHDHDLSAENQNYYIILPPKELYQDLQAILSKIMHFCLINFILNVNVLVENQADEIITAYTYYPFTRKSCKTYQPTVHNRLLNGTLEFDEYPTFPSKLKNLWQCPLLAVVSEEPPFAIVEDNLISGIDVFYLNTLAGIMNFSTNLILAEGGTGKTSPDGVVNGAFKVMEDGIGDLSIGGSFCSVHRMERFSSTTDYFTTYLRIIVKNPQPYSSLEILLLPFDWYTWFTLSIILMAKWIGKVFWKRNSLDTANWQDPFIRFQAFTWLFSILILQSSYEGSIFKFLHNSPRPELPSNLEGVLANGYKIIARSTFQTGLKQFTNSSDRFIFLDVSLSELIEEFNRREGKYALVILGQLFSGNRTANEKYRSFITVKHPILQNILCIYLPKFSYLTKELNHRIKQMKYFGHLKKLYDKLNDGKQSKKMKKKAKKVGKDVNIMSLSKLSGAFQLLGVFMSFGVTVFAVEVISVRNQGLGRLMELVH